MLRKVCALWFLSCLTMAAVSQDSKYHEKEIGSKSTSPVKFEFTILPQTVKDSFMEREVAKHVLVDPEYYTWGMSVIKWKDNKYHGFYSRWPRHLGFEAWLTDSEIVHAEADSPEGPFKFVNVVLSSRNPHGWDNINAHNPSVCVADGKIYLYYISNNLKGIVENLNILSSKEREANWNLFRNSQRIGVAVATDPSGTFNREKKPVVEPDGTLFKNIAVNPAVAYIDGTFIMIMKGDDPFNSDWFRIQLVGHSIRPEGPFIFQQKPLYKKAQTEDAGIWYDQVYEKFYMTCHVLGQPNLALFSSSDGKDWDIHDHLFSKKEIKLSDGAIWYPERMERPFILTDANGNPVCLYVAVKHKDISGNIAIPFKKVE